MSALPQIQSPRLGKLWLSALTILLLVTARRMRCDEHIAGQLASQLNCNRVTIQDTWLVAPEKENPRAHMAMSALARALDNTKKGCIIRFVPRANQAVFVGCATALLGDQDRPDCLVLNYLPFTGTVPRAGLMLPCKLVKAYVQGHYSWPQIVDVLQQIMPNDQD